VFSQMSPDKVAVLQSLPRSVRVAARARAVPRLRGAGPRLRGAPAQEVRGERVWICPAVIT
jgi:hypothetical protein